MKPCLSFLYVLWFCPSPHKKNPFCSGTFLCLLSLVSRFLKQHTKQNLSLENPLIFWHMYVFVLKAHLASVLCRCMKKLLNSCFQIVFPAPTLDITPSLVPMERRDLPQTGKLLESKREVISSGWLHETTKFCWRENKQYLSCACRTLNDCILFKSSWLMRFIYRVENFCFPFRQRETLSCEKSELCLSS